MYTLCRELQMKHTGRCQNDSNIKICTGLCEPDSWARWRYARDRQVVQCEVGRVVIVCIFEHVQWRWPLSDRRAHG